jgi:hypothetical protein
MDTLETSNTQQSAGANELPIGNEPELIHQYDLIREFFQTDNAPEMIASLNALMETVLFCQEIQHITPQMRVDLANGLRVVTLLSRLEKSYHSLIQPGKDTL